MLIFNLQQQAEQQLFCTVSMQTQM